MIVISLAVILVVGLFAGYVLLAPPKGSRTSSQDCDPALLSGLKSPPSGLCLQNLQIKISLSNTSEFIVPVMIVKPGTTTNLEILYQLSSESVQHPGPPQNVTSSEIPTIRSVPSGNVSNLVKFSNGTMIYGSHAVDIYSYSLTASPGSDGYYAILPPFYFGFLPVLAVGASPDRLNESALSNWGYDGTIISGEFMLPSYVVGTGDATLVNATVPGTQVCPSPLCNLIAHSGS
jgi:hypothetical protein